MNTSSTNKAYINLYSSPLLRRIGAALIASSLCFQSAARASGSDASVAAIDCEPQFTPLAEYDHGVQSSTAVHPSGLVLEFHKTDNIFDSSLWYRLGTLDGPTVSWAGSRRSVANGYQPAVAVTKEGYVILVFSSSPFKNESDLSYHIGQIDPYGGNNQSISWLTPSIRWDRGFNGSIAINDDGVIVGVHETGHASTGLYYRVGHFRNPPACDFTIQWDSSHYGIQYEDGINPQIAINNRNQVVEVHQVPGESLLHYRRGSVNGGTINLGQSRRYDDNAEHPAVALLDNGTVLAADSMTRRVNTRTGKLSLANPDDIQWSAPVNLETAEWVGHPTLAATNKHAIVTCETSLAPFSVAGTKSMARGRNRRA